MLKKITVVLYLIIINCFFTQAEEKEKIKLGLETTSHLSYTGVNLGLQVNGLLNNHSLGIGAKVTFQSSYFPHKNSMGVIIDYKYFLISNLKIKSFISVN
ncbi:MAG: hypothetical protein KDD29_08700 [Flavobacteriales bacterium]|nr:hypothetical protein [Flavobacteriales bacterium]